MVELTARQDDGIPDGVVFIPFAYVEAAANLLTNPALDPFGKIPGIQILRRQGRGGRSGDAGGGGVGDSEVGGDDVREVVTLRARTRTDDERRRPARRNCAPRSALWKNLRPRSRAAANSFWRADRDGGGGILLAAIVFGAIRFDRGWMAGAVAALLGGIVVWGSNGSTAKEAAAELTAAEEASRAALIGPSISISPRVA